MREVGVIPRLLMVDRLLVGFGRYTRVYVSLGNAMPYRTEQEAKAEASDSVPVYEVTVRRLR